ncbi:excalibur calcium-binding domain-containing protein [Agrococcus jenensis]|uniref:Excalibur calcium-binding domain-containing protein n=1 Tax=Agrococcus jenensis TaxID=46353 RepID=A0A3N2AS06_9MICO|nr:excalibur calcium-binding domain-containing protein [Agrococcus jenensis]
MPAMPPFQQPGPGDSTRGRTPNPMWAQGVPATAYVGTTAQVARTRRRGAWFWVLISLAAVVVLLLSNCAGIVIGVAAAGGIPTQLAETQQALDDATVEVADAQSAEAEARALVASCEQEAEALQGDLDEAVAAAAAGGADLDTANARVTELEASIAGLEARIVELEASLASAQAAAAPAPAPAPPAAAPAPAAQAPAAPARPAPVAGSGSSSGGGNVYYANCTAARNAGAAPVYRGEPGYASHLDRDNDGVGCE